MSYIKADSPKEQKHFDFLEELRQSGDTNMYGAAPYLVREFPGEFTDIEEKRGLNQGYRSQQAVDVLSKWMKFHDDPKRIVDKKAKAS